MIPGTSAMDKPVAPSGPSRARLALFVGAGALVLSAWPRSLPAILRWARADRAVDASRLQLRRRRPRGDLDRDVSAQGRIVAALHPTLFSPVAGHRRPSTVKAGTEVKKGQLLARVESPELDEPAGAGALDPAARCSPTSAARRSPRARRPAREQQADILAMRLAAAERAMTRAEELSQQGLINRVDFERAKDDLTLAGSSSRARARPRSSSARACTFEVAEPPALGRAPAVGRAGDGAAGAGAGDGGALRRHGRHRERAGPRRGGRERAVLTVVNLSAFEVEFDVAGELRERPGPGHAGRDPVRGQDLPGQGDGGLARDPRQPGARDGRVRRPRRRPACARASASACACCSSARRTC